MKFTTKLFLIILSINFPTILYSQKIDSASRYVGVNFIPLYTNSLDLSVTKHIKPWLSQELSTGLTINPDKDCVFKVYTGYDIHKKNGAFVKAIYILNARNSYGKWAPFLGGGFLSSFIAEKGRRQIDIINLNNDISYFVPVSRKSLNIALIGKLGISSPVTRLVSFDLGSQIAYIPKFNALNKTSSYIPGLGFYCSSIQFIFKFNRRI